MQEKPRLLTISFASIYILYVEGMLYSSEFEYGGFDLEVKLSLLAFPLLFSTSDLSIFTQSRSRHVFGSFIAGCIVGSLILLVHGFLNFRTGLKDAFYYTNLSWYFHSSYLAMYFTFAICILLVDLSNDIGSRKILRITGLTLAIKTC